MKKVPEILREGADTYEERNKVYGDNYKRHGAVMAALFPNGADLQTTDDHNRFGVLTQMVAKLGRYCENWSRGGHPDSTHDLVVYTGMLHELDLEIEARVDQTIARMNEDAAQWRADNNYQPEEPLVIDPVGFLGDTIIIDDPVPTVFPFPDEPELNESELAEAIAATDAPSEEPPVVIPEPPQQK
jgi:hypothetical protein